MSTQYSCDCTIGAKVSTVAIKNMLIELGWEQIQFAQLNSIQAVQSFYGNSFERFEFQLDLQLRYDESQLQSLVHLQVNCDRPHQAPISGQSLADQIASKLNNLYQLRQSGGSTSKEIPKPGSLREFRW